MTENTLPTVPAATSAGTGKTPLRITKSDRQDQSDIWIGEICIGRIQNRVGTVWTRSGLMVRGKNLTDAIFELGDGLVTLEEIKQALRSYATQ